MLPYRSLWQSVENQEYLFYLSSFLNTFEEQRDYIIDTHKVEGSPISPQCVGAKP